MENSKKPAAEGQGTSSFSDKSELDFRQLVETVPASIHIFQDDKLAVSYTHLDVYKRQVLNSLTNPARG